MHEQREQLDHARGAPRELRPRDADGVYIAHHSACHFAQGESGPVYLLPMPPKRPSNSLLGNPAGGVRTLVFLLDLCFTVQVYSESPLGDVAAGVMLCLGLRISYGAVKKDIHYPES